MTALFLLLLSWIVLLSYQEKSTSTFSPTYLQPSKNMEKDVPKMPQALEAGVIIQVNAEGQSIDWEDGKCTLPEAILSANQNPPDRPTVSGECLNGQGNDTIIFDGLSTVTLTVSYGLDPTYGPLGLPPITSTMTISGGIEGVVIKRAFDATENFRILQIEGTVGRLTLENITLEGGNSVKGERPTEIHELGGSIILYNQAGLTLTNNSLITGTRGGGIYATQKSEVSLIDSMISRGTGTGIKVEDHSNLRLLNSTVENMVSAAGGGLSASDYSTIELNNSDVRYNIARRGGGISTDNLSDLILRDSNIISNTAKGDNGGGLMIWLPGPPDHELTHKGHVTIENSRITHNRCQKAPPLGAGPLTHGLGGGIEAVGSDITIIDSQISYNDCWDVSGISAVEGNLTIKNSQLTHNTGGFALSTNSYTQLSDNTYISDNHGGIKHQGHMEIRDSHIINNLGNGIFSLGGELTVCNSSIMSNTSRAGAGVLIHHRPIEKGTTARFVNSKISYNKAAIFEMPYNPLTLSQHIYSRSPGFGLNPFFYKNVAFGGGIYSHEASIIIENSELIHNHAVASDGNILSNTKGGAIYAADSHLEIIHSILADNEALLGSGIFVADENELPWIDDEYFKNGIIEYNAIQNLGNRVLIRNSAIMDNSHIAITGTDWITATHNWWGQPDGPSGAGPGNGDSVGAVVNFSNFYTQPVSIDAVEFPCREEGSVFLPWVEQ